MKPLDDLQRSLCEKNMSLVSFVIRTRFPAIHGDLLRDLIAVGYLSLVEAASMYEPTRGAAFSTYAVHRIWGRCAAYLSMGRAKMRATPTTNLGHRCGEDLHSLIEDLGESVEELASRRELAEAIESAVGNLSAESSHAVTHQFGLSGNRELNTREYAAANGMGRGRSWSLRNNGLGKLSTSTLLAPYAEEA